MKSRLIGVVSGMFLLTVCSKGDGSISKGSCASSNH